MKRLVVVKLTPNEADMLSSVAGNGWGDGDFAEWLGSKWKAAACRRAMRKLDNARNSENITQGKAKHETL